MVIAEIEPRAATHRSLLHWYNWVLWVENRRKKKHLFLLQTWVASVLSDQAVTLPWQSVSFCYATLVYPASLVGRQISNLLAWNSCGIAAKALVDFLEIGFLAQRLFCPCSSQQTRLLHACPADNKRVGVIIEPSYPTWGACLVHRLRTLSWPRLEGSGSPAFLFHIFSSIFIPHPPTLLTFRESISVIVHKVSIFQSYSIQW